MRKHLLISIQMTELFCNNTIPWLKSGEKDKNKETKRLMISELQNDDEQKKKNRRNLQHENLLTQ